MVELVFPILLFKKKLFHRNVHKAAVFVFRSGYVSSPGTQIEEWVCSTGWKEKYIFIK